MTFLFDILQIWYRYHFNEINLDKPDSPLLVIKLLFNVKQDCGSGHTFFVFTQSCRFGMFYGSIPIYSVDVVLNMITILFLQKFEVSFGFVPLKASEYKANMFDYRI